jgi:hypothetical protein
VRRQVIDLNELESGSGFGLALSFSLDQLPNYTDFTNLFDNYSIDMIDITVIPGVNSLQVFGVPDFDDAVAPGTVNEVLERQNCTVSVVSFNSYQQHRVRIVPRVPVDGASGAGPQLAPVGVLCDTSDASIQYFGYKFWLQTTDPNLSSMSAPFRGSKVVVAYHLRFVAAK